MRDFPYGYHRNGSVGWFRVAGFPSAARRRTDCCPTCQIESLRLGIDHGLFCVGCCWALMLVTLVVGMGSLDWMLALAAAMAAEINLRWGRRLRGPVGDALLAWGVGIAVANR